MKIRKKWKEVRKKEKRREEGKKALEVTESESKT
jgi:hypothetical protein